MHTYMIELGLGVTFFVDRFNMESIWYKFESKIGNGLSETCIYEGLW